MDVEETSGRLAPVADGGVFHHPTHAQQSVMPVAMNSNNSGDLQQHGGENGGGGGGGIVGGGFNFVYPEQSPRMLPEKRGAVGSPFSSGSGAVDMSPNLQSRPLGRVGKSVSQSSFLRPREGSSGEERRGHRRKQSRQKLNADDGDGEGYGSGDLVDWGIPLNPTNTPHVQSSAGAPAPGGGAM